MKILVIDFSGKDELAEILSAGHEIIVEKEDGGRAYKTAGELLPEKIVINYSSKPGHGRLTALSIKNRKKTSCIPIFFVDGSEEENRKIQDYGHCVTRDDLVSMN